MANHADIRYIQFYTDGSAARKIAPTAPVTAKPVAAKRTQKKKRVKIYVDPVAVLGIVVSAIMLICIFVGISGLEQAEARCAAMEQTVADLTVENARLQEDYKEGYDLQSIGAQARALGMVPQSSVEHISISVVTEPEAKRTQSISRFVTVLADLFA